MNQLEMILLRLNVKKVFSKNHYKIKLNLLTLFGIIKKNINILIVPFEDSKDSKVNFNLVYSQEKIQKLRKENLILRKYLLTLRANFLEACS